MNLSNVTVLLEIVDKITAAWVFISVVFNVTAFVAFVIFMAMR